MKHFEDVSTRRVTHFSVCNILLGYKFKRYQKKKLSNKNFVENAPKQIVLNERKKVSDAKEKIKILERSLAAL